MMHFGRALLIGSALALLSCNSTTEADALSSIKKKLPAQVAKADFSGAVLVGKADAVLFSQAYGLGDRERGAPNTLTTRFRLGSMNKMFTGVAVLQLVQAKRIDLAATLDTYLPEYPNKEVSRAVTIHHLLTHTGGTGDFFGPEYDMHRNELRTLHDYVARFGQRGLKFMPGQKFGYSNYGYILLGAVIEKVSGQSYYDYVQEHIFAAAGMTASGSEPEDKAVAERAIGYMANGKPNTETLPYRGTSAGGGYSTVGDMHRFAQALLSHTLLDAQHTDLLVTNKLDGEEDSYGYGFGDSRSKDGRGWVGHNGGAPGMNGALRIYPRSGYAVVALANVAPPAAEDVCGWIAERLPD
jgi:CubicO group peptidase (beta-lactamase class C family)